ncbi:MAG: homoserine O-succinyltransferase [Acidiferrobacterales bacterium]
MPLVAHSRLPAFERLRQEGQEVLGVERALRQDIRELHIGLLNMMPDAALQATERQFLRLVGSCNRVAQFYVHPFAVDAEARSQEAQAYLQTYYEDYHRLQHDGLDALVITGANPAHPDLTKEAFWEPMTEVIAWAREHICSIVFSCLATHAYLKQYHGVERIRLPQKRWGVYSHRVLDSAHPLVSNINTRFDAPHSHVYEVTHEQVEGARLRVLAESKEAGVHMAVSADGFRGVYFQGHPEYDINSLLKEYKREVSRFINGERDDYPPYPEHYFAPEAIAILEPYKEKVVAAKANRQMPPEFPESRVKPYADNTWSDTGKAMFNNWLGLVYQLTDVDRKGLFMQGVDPNDPLNLKKREGLTRSA